MKRLNIAGVFFLALLIMVTAGCGGSGELMEPHRLDVTSGDHEIHFDLVVYGSEPEGIAAAVSGGRGDLQVLLIDPREELGGLFTLGALNFLDMNHGKDRTLLTQGIFEEFYNAVGGTAFDLEHAKAVFGDLLGREETVSALLGYELLDVIMEDQILRGIVIRSLENNQEYRVYAKQFIDASADADLAAMAGAPYTFAGEDIGERDREMGVTLVFTVDNVDWKAVRDHIRADGDVNTGIAGNAAWGYTAEGYGYVPVDPDMRLRGFNAARQDNGEVLINALLIFGVDVLDPESRREGIARAEKELEYLIPYINEHFVGFEQARLVRTAEELYVRESRHILSEYMLTIDDVLEHRDHWDKVAIVSYPVDVQPTMGQRYGTIIGNPDRYAIPFRSLVPLEVDNLMVVGRSAGYTSLAAGSARVVPVGMASAEGAGVAAWIAINYDLTPRELSQEKGLVAMMQRELKRRGAYLEDINVPDPEVMSHWAYPGVQVIRALGLLDGGYANDYRLDQRMGKWRFQNLMTRMLPKAGMEGIIVEVSEYPVNEDYVVAIANLFEPELTDYWQAMELLKDKGIMTELLEPYFQEPRVEGYAAEVNYLIANLYLYLTSD